VAPINSRLPVERELVQIEIIKTFECGNAGPPHVLSHVLVVRESSNFRMVFLGNVLKSNTTPIFVDPKESPTYI